MPVYSNYDGPASHAGWEDCSDNVLLLAESIFTLFFLAIPQVYRSKRLVKPTSFPKKKKKIEWVC